MRFGFISWLEYVCATYMGTEFSLADKMDLGPQLLALTLIHTLPVTLGCR